MNPRIEVIYRVTTPSGVVEAKTRAEAQRLAGLPKKRQGRPRTDPGAIERDSAWVRAHLARLGLTVADAARLAGVPESTLGLVRRGKGALRPEHRAALERIG